MTFKFLVFYLFQGMGKDMLALLEVPKSVTDKLETIDTIEKALHKVRKI